MLVRSSSCTCMCVPPNSFFAYVFVTAGTCLRSHCLATAVSSDSTIPAFRCHDTFHSKVAWHDVFCAGRVVSNTQYVVK
jgi:hypothetical protein